MLYLGRAIVCFPKPSRSAIMDECCIVEGVRDHFRVAIESAELSWRRCNCTFCPFNPLSLEGLV